MLNTVFNLQLLDILGLIVSAHCQSHVDAGVEGVKQIHTWTQLVVIHRPDEGLLVPPQACLDGELWRQLPSV